MKFGNQCQLKNTRSILVPYSRFPCLSLAALHIYQNNVARTLGMHSRDRWPLLPLGFARRAASSGHIMIHVRSCCDMAQRAWQREPVLPSCEVHAIGHTCHHTAPTGEENKCGELSGTPLRFAIKNRALGVGVLEGWALDESTGCLARVSEQVGVAVVELTVALTVCMSLLQNPSSKLQHTHGS
eukprot:6489082-Amphidinium_carterae.1